jgi:hypothetical protein
MAPAHQKTATGALCFIALGACEADHAARDASWQTLDAQRPMIAEAQDAATASRTDMDAQRPYTNGLLRPLFCDTPGDDAIRDIFCKADAPTITGLRDLQDQLALNHFPPAVTTSALSLDAGPPVTADAGFLDGYDSTDPTGVVDTVLYLGHSTALSGHLVSPINPRIIMIGAGKVMTFERGVQQVELVVHDRDRPRFNFYLLSFTQACSRSPGGCSNGDLFTTRIESSWTSVSIRNDEDLKNTSLDCRQCHQRARDTPVLIMRELQSPWTHFFEPDPQGSKPIDPRGVRGRDLVDDYVRAKGDEPYGGVPGVTVRHTLGAVLQNLAGNGQPLFFDAPTIEDERWPLGVHGYASAPLPSPTWERAYEAFKRGEQLPLPYLEPRATDVQKQARLTDAYRQYRAGTLAIEALPNLADVFPDDPHLRARIGLQTEPFATPAEALIQACGSCHNDVLDQTISRARFSIALSRMNRAERDLARERIQLSSNEAGVMPPPEGRQLDSAARDALLAYLQDDQRTDEDNALLERAAALGMAGGAEP